MQYTSDVGIIGGGVSGSVIALQLADLGIDTVLFEKEPSLVNGPPFCHLHAGGNLYPDISDEQCRLLMKQSIEMARLFPESIDKRPTLISIPITEKYEVAQVQHRLDMLVDFYQDLISKDPANEILGKPENYYKIYNEVDIDTLAQRPMVRQPQTADEWMTNALHLITYNKLKMPIILVQEFGWNMFRLGAQAQLALSKTDYCRLNLDTEVVNIKDIRSDKSPYHWEIYTQEDVYRVKYLVNSCGFKTGELDDALDIDVERLIEFKAAYIAKWQPIDGLIPELIFHGERRTPHGMAQLTPYRDDYYQIHGMTEDITLFAEGLVESDEDEAQPEFNTDIQQKLNHHWEKEDIHQRTENAIDFVSKFVPSFSSAEVGGPPLYGAQQIPGDDVDLRVGEVSFPCNFYARSEIVKASSALTVANQIIDKLQQEKIIHSIESVSKENSLLNHITKQDIDELSQQFAYQRGYPKALSHLVID